MRSLIVNLSKLFTVFSFFRLKSRDLRYFQYVYPTIFAVLVYIFYKYFVCSYFSINRNIFSTSISNLMGVLIGFYIAALAAVTSFPNNNLDSIMSGNAPEIWEREKGAYSSITRRRFLSMLLGYCAFIAIAIFIFGSINSSIYLVGDVSEMKLHLIRSISGFLYLWMLSSLFVVTMLCLHYLVDRMHRG